MCVSAEGKIYAIYNIAQYARAERGEFVGGSQVVELNVAPYIHSSRGMFTIRRCTLRLVTPADFALAH